MQIKLGRLERRHQRVILIAMSSLRQPVVKENLSTENISPHGLRLVAMSAKSRDDMVQITLELTKEQRLARVVYCQKLADGKYGIGLELLGDPLDWAAEMSSGH